MGSNLSQLITSIFFILLDIFFSSKVLITGGAGFIGFHTGVKLAEDKKNTVVILDIFDDSYDVELKKRRASILKEKGTYDHSNSVLIKPSVSG